MPEVGWPCQGLETAQLFCSSSTAQIHSSPSPGQGSGKQPENGKQLLPRAETSCGGSWTHLCNESGKLREVWQCVAGPAALMCQSKLDSASAFSFLASGFFFSGIWHWLTCHKSPELWEQGRSHPALVSGFGALPQHVLVLKTEKGDTRARNLSSEFCHCLSWE